MTIKELTKRFLKDFVPVAREVADMPSDTFEQRLARASAGQRKLMPIYQKHRELHYRVGRILLSTIDWDE